jgi:photosystem II stability/assembly factor-like uncharacterized protein
MPVLAVPQLIEQVSGIQSRLQAISVVDKNTVWVSGANASVLFTEDAGSHWQKVNVPDSKGLEFRDIYALDSQTIWLMSAGAGELSRIYKTSDGGENWKVQFINKHPKGFLDCFDFWDAENGIAYGDSIEGELYVLLTSNGGVDWQKVPANKLPKAKGSEGGFAASGTCVHVMGNDNAWISTGAGQIPRVLKTTDKGESWQVAETPIVKGEAAGIMSVLFMDPQQGIIFGGDLQQEDKKTANIGLTSDGGKSWSLASQVSFTGAIYGSGAVSQGKQDLLFAVGPKGMDYSIDNAASWKSLSHNNYWAIDFAVDSLGWAVGPEGRITQIKLNKK